MKKRVKDLSFHQKLDSLLIAGFCMIAGLLILKFLPMKIFGENILFDASMHIVSAMFVLYVFWYFIDQDRAFRNYYIIFSFFVLTVISIQRIYANAHNDVGVLAGFVIGAVSVAISRWNYFKGKFSF